MKFYLLFFISLNLAYRGNAQNIIDVLNMESTLISTGNPVIPIMESASGSKENTLISHTENTMNSSEKILTPSTESTLNSTETLFLSSTESTLDSEKNTTTMGMTESPCLENMTPLVKDPETDRWICRCFRPFVILTETVCAELFREGPCGPGNYLFQTEALDTELPHCIPNPCLEDGLVPINGTCISITTLPKCGVGRPYYIEATMQIGCNLSVPIYNLLSWGPPPQCPPGSRKDKHGICRRKL